MLRYAMIFIFAVTVGCSARVIAKNPDQPVHYDQDYDYTDLHEFTRKLVQSMLSKKPISETADAPIVAIYGLTNRTDEHIDLKSVSDALRAKLHDSGKVRFVAKDQREMIDKEVEYMMNSGKVDPATHIKLAKQAGARYMLTGTLYSLAKEQIPQVRFKKRELKWYKLTLELTDVETALIAWTDEAEIAREVRKPFIGW
ncbi:MAG: penicillin-binding protein activator LpoB [Candidatus Lindowbacteria bacterium RIFCSPLOWO2_12_FULL_62_27]|nr:MAG: penicillin-binding protein activator LpoB [Candidatus Lindowbacteria bacterium RIFCSPLOWO2_12_FULL_62_27]